MNDSRKLGVSWPRCRLPVLFFHVTFEPAKVLTGQCLEVLILARASSAIINDWKNQLPWIGDLEDAQMGFVFQGLHLGKSILPPSFRFSLGFLL